MLKMILSPQNSLDSDAALLIGRVKSERKGAVCPRNSLINFKTSSYTPNGAAAVSEGVSLSELNLL